MFTPQLTLTELLDDPMTRAVMAADRVDPATLKEILSVVASKLQLNLADYTRRNWAGCGEQKWLSTSLKYGERFGDHDGLGAQVSQMCRMAASMAPHERLPSFATSSRDS